MLEHRLTPKELSPPVVGTNRKSLRVGDDSGRSGAARDCFVLTKLITASGNHTHEHDQGHGENVDTARAACQAIIVVTIIYLHPKRRRGLTQGRISAFTAGLPGGRATGTACTGACLDPGPCCTLLRDLAFEF